MNTQVAKIDDQTGEVFREMGDGQTSLAVQLAQVELNQAVTTARAFPRSLQRARDAITALVMLDEETAEECIYALPRGGKPIRGPSARFAEIVASQYGNCHVGSRVVEVNRFEKYVEAEGVFHDLETGMKRTARVRRRIVDSKGRLYNDDMIVVTGNAACSIALREAVLKGVPKALWRSAYNAADAVIAGDVKTLSERRADAIKAFHTYGVTPDQIFACLEIAGPDEIGLDEIATLTAIFKAIKGGDQKVEDYFPAKTDAAAGVTAAKGTAAKLAQIGDKAGDKAKAPAQGAQGGDQAPAKGKAAKKDKAPAQGAAGTAQGAAEGQAAQDPAQGAEAAATGGAGAQDGAPEAGAAGDGGADAGAPSDPTGGDPDGNGPPASDEEIARARDRGAKARARGMTVDACPPEYRQSAALYEAWHDGYDEAGE